MRRPGSGQAGFSVAWLVVTLPVVMVFMGLVLDCGLILLRAQQLDAATDAAALAATDAWDREHWRWHGRVRIDPDRATALARQYLAQNMPDARLLRVTVGPENRVSLHTEARVPYFFLRILGRREERVTSFSSGVRRHVR